MDVFVEQQPDEAEDEDDTPPADSTDASGSEGGGFFSARGAGKPKKGNKLCGWSWKEKECQPAALCQYKYQASRVGESVFEGEGGILTPGSCRTMRGCGVATSRENDLAPLQQLSYGY